MLARLGRLLIIRSRWEAYAVIYALALGATTRGLHYLTVYKGLPGYLLFLACTAAVFMGGAKILDAVPPKWRGKERRAPDQRDRRGVAMSHECESST
jgi:hypothetical protein